MNFAVEHKFTLTRTLSYRVFIFCDDYTGL